LVIIAILAAMLLPTTGRWNRSHLVPLIGLATEVSYFTGNGN
jgi:hypothetical protein